MDHVVLAHPHRGHQVCSRALLHRRCCSSILTRVPYGPTWESFWVRLRRESLGRRGRVYFISASSSSLLCRTSPFSPCSCQHLALSYFLNLATNLSRPWKSAILQLTLKKCLNVGSQRCDSGWDDRVLENISIAAGSSIGQHLSKLCLRLSEDLAGPQSTIFH